MVSHVVLDGVADGALGVALDVLVTAGRLAQAARPAGPRRAAAVAQRILSIDGRPVTTAAGRRLAVDGALAHVRPGRPDVLVLPGLSAATPAEITALLDRRDVQRAVPLLARAHARGATVAASCSATFLLGAAGLLDGHEATTTWWLAPVFATRFPAARLRAERMVVRAGRVVTAGAALAHGDLVLTLLAGAVSPQLAHLVAQYLVLDRRVSQARYLVQEHLRSDDPAIRALERHVLANLPRQLGVAELARATATSPRTLARRLAAGLGTTPQRFVRRLRVAHAVHLLETTDRGVDDVAAAVGYADAAAFRRVFRQETGETPRARRGARAALTGSR